VEQVQILKYLTTTAVFREYDRCTSASQHGLHSTAFNWIF